MTGLGRARTRAVMWLTLAACSLIACNRQESKGSEQPVQDRAVPAQQPGNVPVDPQAGSLPRGDATATSSGDAGAVTQLVELSEANNGETVTVVPGTRLRLTLAGNPTTGYLWRVTHVPVGLGTGQARFVPPASLGPGVGGHFVFEWTIGASLPTGDHTVELGYLRHFEKGKPPLKTFRLVIRR